MKLDELIPLASPIKPESVTMMKKTSRTMSSMPFEVLGDGAAAVVVLGKMEDKLVAVKVFDYTKEYEKDLIIAQRGMNNVLQVTSDRLARPLYHYYNYYQRTNDAEVKIAYFQVMPYIEGVNLIVYLQNNKDTLEKRYQIALHIAQGFRDLHEHKNADEKLTPLAHCDASTANILINPKTLHAYICDFDFALKENQQTHSLDISDKVWHESSPPEHKMGKLHTFTTANDIYRLGLILYGLYKNTLADWVEHDQLSSDKMSNLIRACTEVDPKKRPSAAAVVEAIEEILSEMTSDKVGEIELSPLREATLESLQDDILTKSDSPPYFESDMKGELPNELFPSEDLPPPLIKDELDELPVSDDLPPPLQSVYEEQEEKEKEKNKSKSSISSVVGAGLFSLAKGFKGLIESTCHCLKKLP